MEHEDHEDETLLDRLRETGVGVEDPNIVGDAGPVDVAPGSDGDELIQEADPDDDRPILP
ncbi:MAG: hypothetical protein JWN29_3681 [Acidimicrobiales bacterium]|jgi:hypothetical protein|nr:hypothetical protein [Acidimicrobiales bacterium]